MTKIDIYRYKKTIALPQAIAIKWTWYDLSALIVKSILFIFAVFALWKGNTLESVKIIGFWCVLHMLTLVPKYIPRILYPFIALTVLLNAAGWVGNFYLHYDFIFYDKFVHASTTFTIATVIGYLLHHYFDHHRYLVQRFKYKLAFIMGVSCLVISLGAWWEVVEWVGAIVFKDPNLQETMADMLSDILVNSGGAFSGSVLISRIAQTIRSV